MHGWTRVAFFLLATTALAGCLASEPNEEQTPATTMRVAQAPDQALFVGTIANDHGSGQTGHVGHQIGQLHTDSLGFELLDHNDLGEGMSPEQTPSGFTELHIVDDLGVVSSLTGSRGATLVNVSDPSNIQVLAHITNLDDNWDARISQDKAYLFLGCQGSAAFDCTGIEEGGEGGPSTTGGGPCAPLVTCPGGIGIYDIQMPTAPHFLGYLPMGFTHNVYTWMQNGMHYFANAAGNIGEFDPNSLEFELVSSEIDAVHDIAVQMHPVTGEWILYSGNTGSMALWNVDNPMAPELIGYLDPEAYPNAPPMWHEQTPMPCLLDGRHITIGAGEKGNGLPEPVGIVDTTDPRNPVYLGQWKIPDFDSLTAQQSYRFSLHNVDGSCDGHVAVGHYHAGVWVFDVSTAARQIEPVTLGYYQPHEQATTGASPVVTAPIGALASADAPNVWTAQWSKDGSTLFIPDMGTGLYALQPTWAYDVI